MKKRILSIFALILVVAMMASLVVGCTFFRENDNRSANETYVTVKHNGVTLTISYNEILDYCNGSSRLYYYVNYYGMEIGEALDLCIQAKIQSTYLLAEAMGYLTSQDSVSGARINALYGQGKKAKAEDVLTIAERYAAIFAVNSSIETSLEGFIEEAKADEWSRAYKKLVTENVKEIVLTDATLAYLDKFFDGGEGCLVGADLDESKVKAQIVYDDDTKSDEFVVPSEGYSVAFTSEATENYSDRTEKKNFTVVFNETSEDAEGEVIETPHTYVYDYTLIYPRTTKTEVEEKDPYDVLTIDEVKVNRYAQEADIPQAVKDGAKIRDVHAEYASVKAAGTDKYLIEAYRMLIENMEKNNRSMEYFYKSQFESQALSALNQELYGKGQASFEAQSDIDAQIVSEFKYLYGTNKDNYHGNTADEDKADFISTVTSTGTGLDTLYYHPAVENIDDYFFVKQVLFKFDAEVLAFLEDLRNDEEALEEACKYFMETETVMESNPDYDPDFDCPCHELKEEGATCTDEKCPSLAFIKGESDKTIKQVIDTLQTEMAAIYADANKTDAEKSAAAYDLFENYLYSYCDDAGSFNANWGYLVAPEKEDNSWVENFTNLAKDIFNYDSTVGNTFVADGEMGVCYTYSLTGSATSDYAGVTVMMVSATPFEGIDGSALDISQMSDAEIITYLKSRVKGDGTTLYQALRDGLLEEAKSQAYTDYVSNMPTEIFERDPENNKITVNKDYKDSIKINVRKLKKHIYDEYLGK